MAQPTILQAGGKVGGKYEVVEVIGYGGMGVVYKVRELVGAVSRIRALKTVLPQYMNDAAVVRRFREEAEKMCMLEHENIVPVLAYSEEGEFPFLVMPFLEGQTLKEYLAAHMTRTGRPLPLAEVVGIGVELVRGLEVAHHFVNPETGRPQPMVHRDIKPGNVMVRVAEREGERRLRVLIMDFGIAKVLSEDDTAGHTLTDVIGTVRYASPEQVRRQKDIDPRADIYSLGHLLYELYAGKHLFAGLSEHTVLMRMMQKELEDVAIEFPPETPERFRLLVRRAVAMDRNRRFQDVSEMRVLLREILEEQNRREVQACEQALAEARGERQRAVTAEAGSLAREPLAAGDAAAARGEAALAAGRYAEAAEALREAAAAFASARATAEAESNARRERARQAAVTARQALAGALENERGAHRALPERLRPEAGARELEAAARAALESDAAIGRAEFGAAEESAGRGRVAVTRAGELRTSVLSRVLAETAERMATRRHEIEGSSDCDLAPAEASRARAAVSRAEAARSAGDPLSLLEATEQALIALDAWARAIPAAAAARAAAEARAEANRRARPAAEAATLRLRRERARVEGVGPLSAAERTVLERITAESRRAEADGGTGEFAAAAPVLERAALALAELAAGAAVRIEEERREAERVAAAEAARAERLALLGERRTRADGRLTALPALRPLRRDRRAVEKSLQRTARALAAGREEEAAQALEAAEPVLGALETRARELAAAPPARSTIPLGVVGSAFAVTLLAGGGVLYFARRETPTPPRPAAPTPALARRSDAVVEPPTLRPTAAPVTATAPPIAAATAAPPPTAAPRTEATALVASRELAPPSPTIAVAAPTVPPPLALASVKPTSASLSVPIGSEPRFEAALSQGAAEDLRWELDGAPIGRGSELKLGRTTTQTPGKHRLALLTRDRQALRSWTVEVTAPPLRFSALDPPASTLERPPGTRVAFRAPVDLPESQSASFAWQVNGEMVTGRGSSYDFRADEPGQYAVQVRATAPWGASIANRWSVTVRPKPEPVPTVARVEPEAPKRPDVQAELRAWIRDYCGAFERKDTSKLIELGHLSSEAEATRLRDALAPLQDLRLSCTGASIQVSGEEATVSFDRTDHWRDPRGSEVERALPRITKHLRLRGGRWVAQ